MKTESIIVTHEGWFLFCPCWFSWDEVGDITPIPKHRCSWLFSAALTIQESINWFTYLLTQDDELCGFSIRVRELDEPFELEIDVIDED